jgi:hypothetical protein
MKRFALAALAALTLMGCMAGPGYQDQRARDQRRIEQQRLQSLADQLVRSTSAAWRLASDRGGRVERRERAAMERLYRLEQSAQRLHRNLSGHYRDAASTRREFERVTRAYTEARREMRQLQRHPRFYRAFDEVGRVLERMAPYYGYAGYGAGYGYGNQGPYR